MLTVFPIILSTEVSLWGRLTFPEYTGLDEIFDGRLRPQIGTSVPRDIQIGRIWFLSGDCRAYPELSEGFVLRPKVMSKGE